MNNRYDRSKILNYRTKLVNKFVHELFTTKSFNKLVVDRIVIELIAMNKLCYINYYKLASKICLSILNNNISSINSLDSFITSRISNIHNIVITYHNNTRKLKNRYFEAFKRNLMVNVRLWINQRRIDQIKNHTSTVNEQNKKHVDELNKQFVDIKQRISRVNSKIYTNVVTILGLFIAIMVAVFGSLQLYGSVFHNVNGLTHKGLGKAVILGSLVIFGTYMILSLLLKGLSKLMKFKHFHISLSFTIYFISSLIILSLIGTMIAYPEVCKEIEQHIKCISKIVYVIAAIIFVDMSVFVFKYYNVKKYIKYESKNMSDK